MGNSPVSAMPLGPIADRRWNGAVLFAELALVAAATALVGVIAFAFSDAPAATESTIEFAGGADGTSVVEVIDLDDGAVADPAAEAASILAASAAAMAEVTSVEFTVERDGAPVFIDQFESIALDGLRGQFTVPSRARAQLTVTIDGNLTTEIGAVAIDDDIWISNPVTGDFETLPDGIDIDPSSFFEPEDGWRPLLSNLRDAELVDIEDRGGERYRVRGTAPAADIQNITAGLVRDQEVEVDLWIHPGTSLVTRAEFDTVIDGATSSWTLELGRYGTSFTIRPPQITDPDGGG